MDEKLVEIIKSLIRDEQIEYAIRRVVNDKFDYHLDNIINAKIKEMVSDKAETYIKEHIDKVMQSCVRIDNGWGNVVHHASFEDYVRKYIKEKLEDSWNVSKLVRECVEKRLKKYIETAIKEKTSIGTDKVLEMAYEDIRKEKQNNE